MLLAEADWIQVLAAVLFFLITGVGQWIQKRAREKNNLPTLDESGPPPAPGGWPPPPPLPPPRTTAKRTEDWEEQLRQLLSGELTPPPASPPPLPPPQKTARSDHATPPRDESYSWESEEPSHRPLASFPGSDRTARSGERIESDAGAQLGHASRLERAASAIGHAAGLHENAADRMRVARDRTDSIPPPAAGRGSAVPSTSSAPVRSTEIASVIKQLRHPATARQAILASILLQPPKSLQD